MAFAELSITSNFSFLVGGSHPQEYALRAIEQIAALMAQKKISWVNWNFSDDHRSGAVFKTGTCSGGTFTGTSVLKEAGVWIRERIRSADATVLPGEWVVYRCPGRTRNCK